MDTNLQSHMSVLVDEEWGGCWVFKLNAIKMSLPVVSSVLIGVAGKIIDRAQKLWGNGTENKLQSYGEDEILFDTWVQKMLYV